jgi:hypothetical protein
MSADAHPTARHRAQVLLVATLSLLMAASVLTLAAGAGDAERAAAASDPTATATSEESTTTATSPTTTTTSTTTTTVVQQPSTTTTIATTTTTVAATTSTTVPTAQRPSAPHNGFAIPGLRAATLYWGAPTTDGGAPITRYVVVRSNPGSSTWTTVSTTIPASVHSYTVTGLQNGGLYYFRVAAVNSAGQGTWSGSVSTTTFAAPSAPRGVLVSPRGAGEVSLWWQRPANQGGSYVTRYVIQRSVPGSNSWVTVATLTAGAYSQPYIVTRLQSGVRYGFRIAAGNAVGPSPWSSTVYATTRGLPSAPRSVAVSPRAGSALETWNAPASTGGASIISYDVLRSNPGSTTWTVVSGGMSSSARSFLATGLRPGVRYYFRVAARTLLGVGAWSPTTSVIPAPLGLSVTVRASRTTARPGDIVSYTFTITNTSAWRTGSVIVGIKYPHLATWISDSGSNTYLNYGGPSPWVFGAGYGYSGIPPGASVTRTITVRIGNVTPGTVMPARVTAVLDDADASTASVVNVTAR